MAVVVVVGGELRIKWWNLKKKRYKRTSLVVQWLRLCLPKRGVEVRSLVRELRSYMTCGQNIKQKQHGNKFNKDLKTNLKRVQINASTKQKLNYRSRKQTYGCQGLRGGGINWETGIYICTPLYIN